jgi:hypothetical protein
VGVVLQKPTYQFDANYTNVAVKQMGNLKMSSGLSYGIDAQVGYFIGKRRRFGIGTGITYMMQSSDVTIGNFRVEYQDNDSKNNVYRQVVTSTTAVTEKLEMTTINIPVTLKFKQRFSTRIGFTMDAGILYNVSMSNKWSTDAQFNYEAIYQFARDASGKTITVYDNLPTPDSHDWLLTKEMYTRTLSKGTVEDVFDSLHSRGYNVALNVKAKDRSGTLSYTTGSIGFVLRPAVNVRLTKRIHANVGAYMSYQTFENSTASNYRLIDNMGTSYSSMLNTVSSNTVTTIGLNLGLRYFFGTPKDSDFDGMFDE